MVGMVAPSEEQAAQRSECNDWLRPLKMAERQEAGTGNCRALCER